MVVMKMTHMVNLPEFCDDCIYYVCKPHPYKGWSDICELCGQCMDDDQAEDWIYDGNGRPKNCPLMEVNSDEDSIGERLCEIIAKNVISNESLGEDEDAKAYNQGLEVAIEIIKDYCEVDKRDSD